MSATIGLAAPHRSKRFFQMFKRAEAPAIGPTPPVVSLWDAAKQFWRDIHGKEVQTAGTYSYTWTADQFGHVCVGTLANMGATRIAGGVEYALRAYNDGKGLWGILWAALTEPPFGAGIEWGLAVAIIAVSFWEWMSYRSEVKKPIVNFPLDKQLLRKNAIAAAMYMWIGAGLGYSFHLNYMSALGWSLLLYGAALLGAPFWLRQKIVWQKAGLPYLFRLSEATQRINNDDANAIQNLIDQDAPQGKDARGRQVVIAGPIGSRRTQLAAGIGTEFAFKNAKVRYLSFDNLVEFAVADSDDEGPSNIRYWPWKKAQVVIIDDIGPLLRADPDATKVNLTRFEAMLRHELAPMANVLNRCHTIWVIGDLSPAGGAAPVVATPAAALAAVAPEAAPAPDKYPPTLDGFAQLIGHYCNGNGTTLVIELDPPLADGVAPQRPPGAVVRGVREVQY